MAFRRSFISLAVAVAEQKSPRKFKFSLSSRSYSTQNPTRPTSWASPSDAVNGIRPIYLDMQ
ncbi:hypothetical protein HK096_005282, partial [Nowakowskiella sp. JEL0078]